MSHRALDEIAELRRRLADLDAEITAVRAARVVDLGTLTDLRQTRDAGHARRAARGERRGAGAMKHDEEIDLLRRDLADLRDRVTRLEAEKSALSVPLGHLGLGPDGKVFPPSPLPYNPNIWVSPPLSNDCGCAAGTVCMNAACPRRTTTLCISSSGK